MIEQAEHTGRYNNMRFNLLIYQNEQVKYHKRETIVEKAETKKNQNRLSDSIDESRDRSRAKGDKREKNRNEQLTLNDTQKKKKTNQNKTKKLKMGRCCCHHEEMNKHRLLGEQKKN